MQLRRRDGSFVLPDDPVFGPIYELPRVSLLKRPGSRFYDWILVTNRSANRLRGRWVSGQVLVARVIR
jgi:hypothetical protein